MAVSQPYIRWGSHVFRGARPDCQATFMQIALGKYDWMRVEPLKSRSGAPPVLKEQWLH